MNKDQAKGTAKQVAGRVQQKAGEMVGSTDQQAKGVVKRAEGGGQKKLGDAKEVIRNSSKR